MRVCLSRSRTLFRFDYDRNSRSSFCRNWTFYLSYFCPWTRCWEREHYLEKTSQINLTGGIIHSNPRPFHVSQVSAALMILEEIQGIVGACKHQAEIGLFVMLGSTFHPS